MLGLQVDSPAHGVFECVTLRNRILEDGYSLSVGHPREIARRHMRQTLDKSLVDKLVQHRELVGAAIHHLVDDVLQHVLREVHIVFKIGEGDLEARPSELGRMALRVGVLRAKRRPERCTTSPKAMAKFSALSWPDTVRLAGLPKKSRLQSTSPA